MKQCLYKTKINPRIKKFADKFGIEFRVARDPAKANIVGVHQSFNDQKIIATYFGEGVVWLRDETNKPPHYIDIVCLHELGHGILDFFKLNHSTQTEEVMANGIALAFAAYLKIPVSKDLLKNIDKYSKELEENKWKRQCKNLLNSLPSWVQLALQMPRRKS